MVDRISINLSKIVLHESDYNLLKAALEKLRKDVQARLILVLDQNGHPIAESGRATGLDVTTLASLSAASLAANASLAQVAGEDEFSAVHHHGARQSIYIADFGRRFALVVVLSQEIPVGTMRLRVHRAGNVIDDIFHEFARHVQSGRDGADKAQAEVTPAFSDEEIENLVRHLRGGQKPGR